MIKNKNLCDGCTLHGRKSYCCSYTTHEVTTKSGMVDLGRLSSLLEANPNVKISVLTTARPDLYALGDLESWDLRLWANCRYLQDDGRCGIYEDRPNICAWYQPVPTDHFDDHCERYSPQQAPYNERVLASVTDLNQFCAELGLPVQPNDGMPELELPIDEQGLVDLDTVRWWMTHPVGITAVFNSNSELPIRHVDRWRLFVVKPELGNPDLKILLTDQDILEVLIQDTPSWKIRNPVCYKSISVEVVS